jgi:hypothetical protein
MEQLLRTWKRFRNVVRVLRLLLKDRFNANLVSNPLLRAAKQLQ